LRWSSPGGVGVSALQELMRGPVDVLPSETVLGKCGAQLRADVHAFAHVVDVARTEMVKPQWQVNTDDGPWLVDRKPCTAPDYPPSGPGRPDSGACAHHVIMVAGGVGQ
jgi:hypothetical protein